MSSGLSAAMPEKETRPPCLWRSPDTVYLLMSRTFPGGNGPSTGHISSPEEMSAILGSANTATSATPRAASTPRSNGVSRRPDKSTVAPFSISSPSKQIFSPLKMPLVTSMASPARRTNSCITTPSAPAGTMEPVLT